jgi:hypothetical protein
MSLDVRVVDPMIPVLAMWANICGLKGEEKMSIQ